MSDFKTESTLGNTAVHSFTESMLEQLPGIAFRCINNTQLQMLYLSQGTYLLTGYTPEELMGDNALSLSSLILAEDHLRVWDAMQTATKQQQAFDISYRMTTKHGEQKWVAMKGQAKYTAEYFNNPNDSLNQLILEGIVLDLSQQKQVEQQLQENKKLQYSLLDGSIEGILIHRNWKPLYLNKSLLNMLGYDSYTEVLAMDSVAPLIAEHERERMMNYTQARAKGEAAPAEYEFKALHHDGTLRCVEIKSSLIDWRGQPATFSTLINITERKKAQQQAEQQRQKLSHNNRLNMLGEVTAGIAHELNQPLTAITSRCAAAKNRINRENPDLEKIKEALDSIEEQAIRSGEIIKQLRSLVKTKDNEFQQVNLNELLETCLKFIRIEGLFNTSRITTHISEQLPVVIADPTQIQQVLLNLIRNASEAMQPLLNNERYLTLSAIQHDDSAVQISVSDSGEGISQQQEDNLFQSFYTTKADGMGMGLSISRTIITAHNGRLWFSRNTDRGVTFRFTLPIYLDKEHLKP